MSRSVDTPHPADSWPADDPLLLRLQAARPETPDEIASPHTPANRSMMERIVDGAPAGGGRNRRVRTPRSRRDVRRLLPRAAGATRCFS